VPDGRTLVTADARGLSLWDLATGKERRRVAFPDDFNSGRPLVRGLHSVARWPPSDDRPSMTARCWSGK